MRLEEIEHLFTRGKIVTGGPPRSIFVDTLYAEVEYYSMVTTNSDFLYQDLKKMSRTGRRRIYSGSCLIGNTNCSAII